MSRYNGHDQDGSADTPDPVRLEGIDPGEKMEREVDEMPYLSKSRIKTFLQCPAKFYFKYWCGNRPPENHYMVKGSRLHETFEVFHENLIEYVEREGDRPDRFADLFPHYSNYTQWIEQVGSFIKFEERRWQEARSIAWEEADALNLWLPVEIEAEAWLGEPPYSWVMKNGEPDYVSGEPPVDGAPWMGRADLIVESRSLPSVDGDGVTIIDYKTGSVPDRQYRGEGIYLEGEYYGMLFEEFYDVDAVAGYYPGADELIVSPYPNEQRREKIRESAEKMQELPKWADEQAQGPPENYQEKPQPLCNYGSGNCHFFNVCPSTWGLD